MRHCLDAQAEWREMFHWTCDVGPLMAGVQTGLDMQDVEDSRELRLC